MDAQFRDDLFNADLVIAHLSGTLSDYADDEAPGPKISVRGYVEFKNQIVITPRGEKVNSNTFVVLDADDFDIDEDEHSQGLFEFVWFPRTDSTNDDEARRPKVVQPCTGLNGKLDHWEIFL